MIENKAQDFVPIKDIKDGLIYTDDGRIKAVLAVSSLNLSLKAEEEQNAIISQFQGFLNTLDFPVQVHVESRRINIRPYLDSLEERQEVVTDELMKNQIREYRQFVKTFAEKTNIMNKRFFVIIDYAKGSDSKSNPMSSIMSFGKKSKVEDDNDMTLDSWKTQLEQRISIVAGGLSGVGLQVNMLGTEELVELFYRTYNPGQEERTAEM
jgi:hypothetical protein